MERNKFSRSCKSAVVGGAVLELIPCESGILFWSPPPSFFSRASFMILFFPCLWIVLSIHILWRCVYKNLSKNLIFAILRPTSPPSWNSTNVEWILRAANFINTLVPHSTFTFFKNHNFLSWCLFIFNCFQKWCQRRVAVHTTKPPCTAFIGDAKFFFPYSGTMPFLW